MKKPAMNKRRLLMTAALLEKLPPRRFDYRTWVGEGWKGRADLSCGATACALGWATTIPAFKKIGLRMARIAGTVAIKLGRLRCFEAAAKLYSITSNEARYLFMPTGSRVTCVFLPGSRVTCDCDSCRQWQTGYGGRRRPGPEATAKQVARHIRAFVKYGGMPRGARS